MFTHDPLTLGRLPVSVPGLFFPGGLSDLAVRLSVGINRLCEFSEKALGSFMGKVCGMFQGDLPRFVRVIDQGAGSKQVLRERLVRTHFAEEG